MKPTIITDLSARQLDLPLTEPFTIATGSQESAANVLVRIELAGGAVGLGEAALGLERGIEYACEEGLPWRGLWKGK